VCIWDEKSRGIFSGDTLGVSYREFDTEQGVLIFPPTTPIHFKTRLPSVISSLSLAMIILSLAIGIKSPKNCLKNNQRLMKRILNENK
jgi:hypothetical protein